MPHQIPSTLSVSVSVTVKTGTNAMGNESHRGGGVMLLPFSKLPEGVVRRRRSLFLLCDDQR